MHCLFDTAHWIAWNLPRGIGVGISATCGPSIPARWAFRGGRHAIHRSTACVSENDAISLGEPTRRGIATGHHLGQLSVMERILEAIGAVRRYRVKHYFGGRYPGSSPHVVSL